MFCLPRFPVLYPIYVFKLFLSTAESVGPVNAPTNTLLFAKFMDTPARYPMRQLYLPSTFAPASTPIKTFSVPVAAIPDLNPNMLLLEPMLSPAAVPNIELLFPVTFKPAIAPKMLLKFPVALPPALTPTIVHASPTLFPAYVPSIVLLFPMSFAPASKPTHVLL